MPIKISGVDVSKVLVGSGGGASPAQKIMLGTGSSAVQVWPIARVITVATYTISGNIWLRAPEGDIEIVASTGSTQIILLVPTICDRQVRRDNISTEAGTVINAGARINALVSGVTYTFTEVI